jgi:hypothetical protein
MGTDAAFATLGIAVGAQPIEITRAFRALSRQSHPDTGGEPTVFAAVVAAYRTLQRAGLVRAETIVDTQSPSADSPAEAIVVSTGGGRRPSRVPGPADRHYRRFLDGLERAATMPDLWIDRPALRRLVVEETREAGPTFAEILDRELLRVS